MTTPQNVQSIPTSKLHFDPENPRFYRLNNPSSVEAIIVEMFDEGVQELMASIAQKGYFQGEPLLITADKNGKWIVVEGNRRLAATKLLNGEILPPKRRSNSVKLILEEAKEAAPPELPCIIYPARREVLRYLGYRHITGIKQWDPLSKAKYLAQMQGLFYSGLAKQEQLKALANEIGSKSDYVGKLLTALSLYQRAEDDKFFNLPIREKDVQFSLLTTAIGYNPICDWLGLENSTDIEMPDLDTNNLKSAFSWMFAKNQLGDTILGESRNLKHLASVVASDHAITVLKDTRRLSEAYLHTNGPQAALQKAMEEADKCIRVIWSMLQNVRPITEDHTDKVEVLYEGIDDVRKYLKDKLREK